MPGLAKQYYQAVENARLVSQAVGGENLTFAGHSLGGGLAQAAALATNGTAVTYNPAWLSNSTISKLNLNPSNGNIHNYVISNDILNSVQVMSGGYVGLRHLGSDRMILNFSVINPVKAHLIDSFLKGFIMH